jgi:CHAT domain-containing protein/Tfp pilus assembly protein PilF
MQRVLGTAALIALCCAACATVQNAPLDPRLVEAQKAFDEGQRLKDEGQYAEAVPLVERALELRKAVLGEAHPEVARCLNLLGIVHAIQEDFTRARPLLQRALKLREEALDKNHPDVAESLNSLGNLYQNLGLYPHAEQLFNRALNIREATLSKNHPDLGKSLHNLAYLSYLQGHYAQAEPRYERAIAIAEVALGKDHPHVAVSLISLATLYYSQGHYSRAEPLIHRALAIWEVALGKDHPNVAYPLSTLAAIYHNQGHYARAEPLYERALKIREASLGENSSLVAETLYSLATLYVIQGRYVQAEPLFKRALVIGEETLGENHPDLSRHLYSFANFYIEQRQYAKAELLLQRALAIHEKAVGKNHPEVVELLNGLATAYIGQEDYMRAEPLLQRTLALLQGTPGENYSDLIDSLTNLARIRLAQQNLAEALTFLERAFTTSEEYLRQEVFGFSEARLSSLLHLLRAEEERLYSIVRVHPDNPRARHLAVSAALLRKGRSIGEVADTSRIIYRSLGQADREAFERLRALRTQLSSLSLTGARQLSPADYQQRIKELTDQADALEADLARRSAPLRAIHALPPPAELLDRVSTALPKDSALVEFVAYHDNLQGAVHGAPPSQASGELRYLALLLFGDGNTRAVDLGPSAPIDATAQRLHDALVNRDVAYRPAAEALYAVAFKPLEPHLGKVQRLFLAPDGQLALVPFGALYDGSRFLIDTLDITYLTSGKDLLHRTEDDALVTSVVVLADPDFSSASPVPYPLRQAALTERSISLERFFSTLRSDLASKPWPPLPGTRKEAATIHRLLPQARLLVGAAATKEALLKLETPGLLHIATHGFFLEDAPTQGGTRAVVSPELIDSGPQQRPPDPLLRSGLVLAGAAQSRAARREDSLVTALELAGLDLWGTQLVVLSACDTGRGDVKLGQGVYGLRRALVMAGAQTLVTSLWKVNDDTTRELMERYYHHLLAGQGRAGALREAMMELRQKKPHPYFWAPFIAIGQDAPLQGLASHSADNALKSPAEGSP